MRRFTLESPSIAFARDRAGYARRAWPVNRYIPPGITKNATTVAASDRTANDKIVVGSTILRSRITRKSTGEFGLAHGIPAKAIVRPVAIDRPAGHR
jgi:hypothetical protein